MSEDFEKLFKGTEDSPNYKAEAHFLAVGEIVADLDKENKKLRAALEDIIPMCGNPSAVDACRLIANKCQEALK